MTRAKGTVQLLWGGVALHQRGSLALAHVILVINDDLVWNMKPAEVFSLIKNLYHLVLFAVYDDNVLGGSMCVRNSFKVITMRFFLSS